ncbi:MAG: major capsid protein [Microviridae sp.]|nr:MAG: major capsid protein [Microviridae sp.]
MSQVTIGGQRLGSGNKMTAHLRNYERSGHDLSYTWRSTMAPGTLVPFMSQVALPGDTFDIDLNADVLTHPTIGPLFGSYKLQLDVFQIPMRLYQGQLHMNMLGIGLDMSKILLPQLTFHASKIDKTEPIDNQHVNPSCILSYLGMRGLGYNLVSPDTLFVRDFNAVPYLGYWDIYKNYYANKQEEIGVMIHKNPNVSAPTLTTCNIAHANPDITIPPLTSVEATPATGELTQCNGETTCEIFGSTGITYDTTAQNLWFVLSNPNSPNTSDQTWNGAELFTHWEIYPDENLMIGSKPIHWLTGANGGNGITFEWKCVRYLDDGQTIPTDNEPQLIEFPLKNIDDMRKKILAHTDGSKFVISKDDPAPYGLPFTIYDKTATEKRYSKNYSQEGLAIKTYQSDLLNNWIQTEWIDGADGISAVTAIDTTGGSFTLDELNLSKKIYDMLNRIAISGGSYDDWLDAVYTHERTRGIENPLYLGGLIKEIVFQEVVSQAQTAEQPLGTLAGRGKLGHKHKGGKITAKIDEPSYLMGIVSITPRLDYSQGNSWDVNLVSMNDLHKPGLDEIGFQDLITDQMAWWDTPVETVPKFQSAGKQPAWVNYMTNINIVRGNFADQNQQMFMVLNRRYGIKWDKTIGAYSGLPTISDVTTYIDPVKFNHIFADTRRDAQNFWVQIGLNIEARRKMSAKVMPNL